MARRSLAIAAARRRRRRRRTLGSRRRRLSPPVGAAPRPSAAPGVAAAVAVAAPAPANELGRRDAFERCVERVVLRLRVEVLLIVISPCSGVSQSLNALLASVRLLRLGDRACRRDPRRGSRSNTRSAPRSGALTSPMVAVERLRIVSPASSVPSRRVVVEPPVVATRRTRSKRPWRRSPSPLLRSRGQPPSGRRPRPGRDDVDLRLHRARRHLAGEFLVDLCRQQIDAHLAPELGVGEPRRFQCALQRLGEGLVAAPKTRCADRRIWSFALNSSSVSVMPRSLSAFR